MFNVYGYQDDFLSLNDFGLLERVLSDIYPPKLIINKTNISVHKTNFLDLTIIIYGGKLYNFDVINYPFLDGNIPKGQS